MTQSLRDQLLGLGFKPAPKPPRHQPEQAKRGPAPPNHARKDSGQEGGETRRGGRGQPGAPRRQSGKPPTGKSASGRPQAAQRSREEIDLAKAYAIRAQREKEERIAAEAAKQEEARLRREARAALSAKLAGKALNVAEAEIARHFEYGGKIKRIYVTAEQLKALNAGELGVLQDKGRYLLVSAEVLAEAERIFAPAVALKVDPHAPAQDDPYADPRYQVPDDLVW